MLAAPPSARTDDWVSPGIAGRVALVTGAARGIGAAVARSLSGLGARVALADADALRATTASLPPAVGYRTDVTDADAVDRLVTTVECDLGPIDILVNVAGILRTGDVADTTDDDWAALFAVNTSGVFHLSRAVSRRMRPRGRGSIVTVSSSSNAAGAPRAAVVPMQDAYLGERTYAFVVPRAGVERPAPGQLRAFVRSRGPAAYKIPDKVALVDAFPVTGVGKVSRDALRAALRATLEEQL
jgi:NAD(P)-dependent dehydrogenase (short-subunit alcohol dehydrogenase family)